GLTHRLQRELQVRLGPGGGASAPVDAQLLQRLGQLLVLGPPDLVQVSLGLRHQIAALAALGLHQQVAGEVHQEVGLVGLLVLGVGLLVGVLVDLVLVVGLGLVVRLGLEQVGHHLFRLLAVAGAGVLEVPLVVGL